MTAGRRTRLALFPLGSVLYPGVVLPLHIFEDRYRRLIRELLTQPEGARRFGVVAIRRGGEAGDPRPELHGVGCSAELRRIDPLADGRFNVVAVGGFRFRLHDVDTSRRRYLVGDVEELPEEVGNAAVAGLLADRLRRLFAGYLDALGRLRDVTEEQQVTLPAEPMLLSYLVSAAALLELGDKQRLLAEPDAVARLRAALTLLSRERAFVEHLGAVPAADLLHDARSMN